LAVAKTRTQWRKIPARPNTNRYLSLDIAFLHGTPWTARNEAQVAFLLLRTVSNAGPPGNITLEGLPFDEIEIGRAAPEPFAIRVAVCPRKVSRLGCARG
jgi:hypothetical protein